MTVNLGQHIQHQTNKYFEEDNQCLVHEWTVNNKQVKVFRKENNLECEVFDKDTINKYRTIIPCLENMTVEKMASLISLCEVFIDSKNNPHFSHTFLKGSFKNREIRLICLNEKLLWQIFDKSLKTTQWVSYDESTKPSERCHFNTAEVIENLKNEPIHSRIEFIQKNLKIANFNLTNTSDLDKLINGKKEIISNCRSDCKSFLDTRCVVGSVGFYTIFGTSLLLSGPVGWSAALGSSFILGSLFVAGSISHLIPGIIEHANVELEEEKKLEQLVNKKTKLESIPSDFFIELEPKITAKSRIDERVLVSKFIWALTVITYGGSEGNHAKLVAEGVNDGYEKKKKDGEYFMRQSDLKRENVIESELFPDNKKLFYETRSEVWLVTSQKVKNLLDSIQEDIPEDKPLNFCGRDSFLSRGKDNCFTYLREKLKVHADIDLGKSYVGCIATRTKNYTTKPEYYQDMEIHPQI